MKVILISPTFHPDVGGVETMLFKFCEYLEKKDIQADVITYSPLIARVKVPLKERFNRTVTVWRIPWIGYGLFNVFEKYPFIQFFYLVPALAVTTLLFLLFVKRKPEIIHVFGLSGAFVGGIASKLYRIPSLVDMCTVYRLSQRKTLSYYVKLILNWNTSIRANNPEGKNELIQIGMDPSKIGLISPPVDESVFQPINQITARKKTMLPLNKFIVLFVGRMVESKRIDIAAKVPALISNPNVLFVFIGDGPLIHIVKDLAVKNNKVIVRGTIEYNNLVYYYNAADILYFAPVDSQLLAFVGREALMCGLPILAPNDGKYFGISQKVKPDIISSAVGKLLDPTPEAFASYILQMVKFKDKFHSLPFKRRDCRAYAIKHYSYKALNWLGNTYERLRINY